MTSSLALDSIEISNFRALRHLKLEKLSRVNLIVGKNNVGKTTVLEAIWVYAQGGTPYTLIEVLANRNEAVAEHVPVSSLNDAQQFSALRNLFFQRSADEPTPDPVYFSAAQPIQIEGSSTNGTHITHQLELFAGRFGPSSTIQNIDDSVPLDIKYGSGEKFGLIVKQDKDSRLFEFNDGSFGRAIKKSAFNTIHKYHEAKLMPVEGFDPIELDGTWDYMVLRDTDNDIVKCLQLIQPSIERIHLVKVAGRNGREPYAKIAGIDEPVTLKSLGEGMNRLFGISVILVQAKGGIALIDEIDTGIHYSVLSDLWGFVFKVAKRLNVQLFATTHSWDCIEGFSEALQSDESFDGQLISLRRSREVDDDTIYPVSYDRQEIAIATKSDIEVR